MRFFNTEGPIDPNRHYHIPPLERWDLEHVLELIEQQRYFLLHAPRQTGKTSCMMALMRYLNGTGRYRAAYANVEQAQAHREDVESANISVIGALVDGAIDSLDDRVPQNWRDAHLSPNNLAPVRSLLAEWARQDQRPLLLLLDEVDALVGDSLISLLRQLRAGYPSRPAAFPQSVVLCGVRDLHDFNIKAESLRLGDFSFDEVRRLYLQHTQETGQLFEDAAIERVWELTNGQPWLVNAIAQHVTLQMRENRDRSRTIARTMIDQAKEHLIVNRVTHIDQLGHKLREDRVRRVIEPMILGLEDRLTAEPDDISYVTDLGLIRRGPSGPEISNPIYREVIPRYLAQVAEEDLWATHQTAWYVRPDGTLDIEKLLTAFQQFFREHSEHWVERFDYKEAGPQLLIQAFLHRIVNGGGRIEREYGLGRGRIDLMIVWSHPGGEQREALELKVGRPTVAESMVDQGMDQIAEYLGRAGLVEGHLILFDRSAKGWDEKVYHAVRDHRGRRIHLWGL